MRLERPRTLIRDPAQRPDASAARSERCRCGRKWVGGGSRTRTYEAYAADLQSAPFAARDIPPNRRPSAVAPVLMMRVARRSQPDPAPRRGQPKCARSQIRSWARSAPRQVSTARVPATCTSRPMPDRSACPSGPCAARKRSRRSAGRRGCAGAPARARGRRSRHRRCGGAAGEDRLREPPEPKGPARRIEPDHLGGGAAGTDGPVDAGAPRRPGPRRRPPPEPPGEVIAKARHDPAGPASRPPPWRGRRPSAPGRPPRPSRTAWPRSAPPIERPEPVAAAVRPQREGEGRPAEALLQAGRDEADDAGMPIGGRGDQHRPIGIEAEGVVHLGLGRRRRPAPRWPGARG